MGIWKIGPKNWDWLKSQPRYFIGKQVLVRTTIDPSGKSNEKDFLCYHEKLKTEYVTHKAKIIGVEDDMFTVEVAGKVGPMKLKFERS
eukprot:UN25338